MRRIRTPPKTPAATRPVWSNPMSPRRLVIPKTFRRIQQTNRNDIVLNLEPLSPNIPVRDASQKSLEVVTEENNEADWTDEENEIEEAEDW